MAFLWISKSSNQKRSQSSRTDEILDLRIPLLNKLDYAIHVGLKATHRLGTRAVTARHDQHVDAIRWVVKRMRWDDRLGNTRIERLWVTGQRSARDGLETRAHDAQFELFGVWEAWRVGEAMQRFGGTEGVEDFKLWKDDKRVFERDV